MAPGQSSQARAGEKQGSATCGKGGGTLAETEVAGPFRIRLESGSRVLIGFLSRSAFLDWPESWHLRVHQSAWQRAADWWMSVPGLLWGFSAGAVSVTFHAGLP